MTVTPEVNVEPSEYHRLLVYRRGAVLSERARELAEWAREGYRRHGRPWTFERQGCQATVESLNEVAG